MNDDHGAASSFEDAYRRYYDVVRRYATTRFGEDEADDIAQETMLRAWARFDEIAADDRPLSPWLIKVAGDVGIDRHRRRQRLVVDGETVERASGAVPDESARVAFEVDTRPLLRRALSRLSPGEQRTLALHAVADAGIGEIAVATGMTANAVRQRLFRARRNLRHHYFQLGGQDYATSGPVVLATRRPAGDGPVGWVSRVVARIHSLPNVPPGRPAVAAALLATLVVAPASHAPLVATPPRPPAAVQQPATSPVSLPAVPHADRATSAVRRVAAGSRVVVAGVLGRATTSRVEAESGDIDAPLCGDGTAVAVPDAGASGGLAVYQPGSGCALSFSTRTERRVSAVRFSVGGWSYQICGHFEISGAIAGESDSICDAAGNWLLVPVESTGGVGAFTVTWVVDDASSRTWLDASIDYVTLAPAAAPAPVARCADGVDDDGDGAADYPADSACSGAYDDDERSYGACDDGIDNDHDGKVDYGVDQACSHWGDQSEGCDLKATNADEAQQLADCSKKSGELPEPPPLPDPPFPDRPAPSRW